MSIGENCVVIGVVTKTHGLQGNVVINSDTDCLEKCMNEPVFLLLDGAPVPFFISDNGLSVRNHKSYIVKFDDVDTKEQAERLTGAEVMVDECFLDEEDEAEWLTDEGAYRLSEFEVIDLNTQECGKAVNMDDFSGNVVLTLEMFGKEILLPLSEEYIKEVKLEERKMFVSIPQELIDLF